MCNYKKDLGAIKSNIDAGIDYGCVSFICKQA